MVKERTSSKRADSSETCTDLVREFKHLRILVREIGENFILRQEGEIETVISQLESLPPGKLRAVAPALIEDLRKLKVKPAKGRFKDLKELTRLIEDLAGRVMVVEARGKGK